MKTLCYLFLFLLLFSCESDNPNIELTLVQSSKEENKLGLEATKLMLDKLVKSKVMVMTTATAAPAYSEVKLIEEVGRLFDPLSAPCSLPTKIKNKIKSTYKDTWAPKEVTAQINSMNISKVLLVDASYVSVLLHTVTVKPASGDPYEIVASDAFTYNNLPIANFINGPRNKFAFNYDCSGYLSAALKTSAKAPAVDIQNEAGISLSNSRSIFIGAAFVFSPIHAALITSSAKKMSVFERLSILSAIKAKLSNTSTLNDVIEARPEFDLLWTSSAGDSKFNGDANLEGSAGGGIGIASISFSSNGTAKFSRSSSYSKYSTYILDRPTETVVNPITINDLNKSIISLMSRSIISNPAQIINSKLVVGILLPELISNYNWTIKEPGFTIESISYDQSSYEFRLEISGTFTGVRQITLTESTTGLNLERRISLP